jgi:hypothetical protein
MKSERNKFKVQAPWVSNPLEWLFFNAGLPKPNATLLLYPGLGPVMLRRLRRESLSVSKFDMHNSFVELYDLLV